MEQETAPATAPAPSVLRALPRNRTVAAPVAGERRPARMERLPPPQPGGPRVLMRTIRWSIAGLRLGFLLWVDYLTGRASNERSAVRLRDTIAGMGPVARKVARVFGHRLDLLPAAFARHLTALEDFIPPLDTDVVVKLVEDATGGPLASTFRAFDPEPLGSRVLRCTYQAELLDGTPVVVRVRPPGMRERLAAEVAAVGSLLRLLEVLTVVRPGFFQYLRNETLEFLMEESDFRLHVRAQNLLRRRVRADRIRFVEASGALSARVTDAVAINGKVDGLRLGQVIAAASSGDPAQLTALALRGIDPRQVARRLLQYAWWEISENLFFHIEPTPDDILVTAGGRLVPVHFHDTVTTSDQNRRRLKELFRRLTENDVSGATEVLLQYLTPLPFIDTYTFSKKVESRLWHQLFAYRDPEAPWWERTSTGVWSALLDTTRESGVPVHMDVIHLIRSLTAYETMALKLHPALKPLKEFQRYQRRADRRVARRWQRDGRRDARHFNTRLAARVAGTASLFRRAVFFLESVLENLPVSNLALPQKAAYAASLMLQTTILVTLGATVGTLGVLLFRAFTHRAIAPSEVVPLVLRHPAYLTFVGLLVLSAVRRMLFRLSDTDPE